MPLFRKLLGVPKAASVGKKKRAFVVPPGQQAFTTAGSYSWVAPAGVTSVSVVAVGGGGPDYYNGGSNGTSGSGGNLGYKNNITVIPGNSYAVVVGVAGATNRGASGPSSFNTNSPLVYGGTNGTNSSAATEGADGGGRGGNGATDPNSYAGGGGAGGYSGNGGNGGRTPFGGGPAATNGAGGGGGGGDWPFGIGGGVGLLGEGANGTAGGGPGSGGSSKFYGGGGAANDVGGNGAVRIIWPGTTRSFPSTNTGNL